MKLFPRTVARLAAVQAVFQGMMRPDLTTEDLIQEFLSCRLSDKGELLFLEQELWMDLPLFRVLVQGSQEKANFLEKAIEEILPQGWTLYRMEKVSRSILRCASFELAFCPETPKAVIFNEYVTAGHCFLLNNGHKFINGFLENLSRSLRLSPSCQEESHNLDADSP